MMVFRLTHLIARPACRAGCRLARSAAADVDPGRRLEAIFAELALAI
jgi:hypothetical protein